MPKVSVVISTYNRPEKLKNAIQSVIDQTFKDWELIIVHDGKSSSPIAEPTNRISYFELDTNFGNDTKPKNKGILESKGEYVAFLDDDNTFRPDHLEVLVKALDENPDIALVYGERWVTDEDMSFLPQVGTTAEYELGLLMDHNFIDTSDVLVRKEALYKVGGFDERYRKYIDWNMWLRMEKAGFLFKQVPLVITDYYISSSSKSKSVLTDKEKEFMDKTGMFMNLPDWDATEVEVELPYLGEKSEPRIAIFSLTYDRLEYTKVCFESLQKTAGVKFDHYVVDNGSSDKTPDWLVAQRRLGTFKEIILNKENKGISIASNQALDAIAKGNYDIIMKVDNDCLFLNQGWLARMVDLWKSNHRIALSCYIEGLKDNPGGAPRIARGQLKGEALGWTKHLGGICHFVDASAYSDFRWPEDEFLHGMQDLELSQHLERKGFMMCYLENWFAEHIDGTEGQHFKYPQYFERRKGEKTTRFKKL